MQESTKVTKIRVIQLPRTGVIVTEVIRCKGKTIINMVDKGKPTTKIRSCSPPTPPSSSAD